MRNMKGKIVLDISQQELMVSHQQHLSVYQFISSIGTGHLSALSERVSRSAYVLITKLGDNLVVCLHAVEPIAKILQSALQQPNLEDIFEMTKLFPLLWKWTPTPFMLSLEILSHIQN